LDSSQNDIVTANQAILREWKKHAADFPNIALDFSGELDDVQDSINAMILLFLLGMGLIYLLLGTQFKSYLQPVIIIIAVPMAFIGVVLGLMLSGNPLSLYTLYGVIALAGIAANDAIVLISTANRKLKHGWSVPNAIVYASRRRVVPILITTLTTIAGLFSLATGLGGESLMWGPVATAIVWGLGFSTILTLFFIPLLFNVLVNPVVNPFEASVVHGGDIGAVQPFLWFLNLFRFHSNSRMKKDEAVLKTALADTSRMAAYCEGLQALKESEAEVAIRQFQKLADEMPDVYYFNLYAAQGNILLMQRIGWDIGYIARAEKYLARAKNINSEDRQLEMLEKACAQLNLENEP
jgi:hypothetical protein